MPTAGAGGLRCDAGVANSSSWRCWLMLNVVLTGVVETPNPTPNPRPRKASSLALLSSPRCSAVERRAARALKERVREADFAGLTFSFAIDEGVVGRRTASDERRPLIDMLSAVAYERMEATSSGSHGAGERIVILGPAEAKVSPRV